MQSSGSGNSLSSFSISEALTGAGFWRKVVGKTQYLEPRGSWSSSLRSSVRNYAGVLFKARSMAGGSRLSAIYR